MCRGVRPYRICTRLNLYTGAPTSTIHKDQQFVIRFRVVDVSGGQRHCERASLLLRRQEVPAVLLRPVPSVPLPVLLLSGLLHLMPGEGVVVQVPVIGRHVVQLVESLWRREHGDGWRMSELPPNIQTCRLYLY